MAKRKAVILPHELVTAHGEATAWVSEYVSTTPLPMPANLDEAAFGLVMDAVVRAAVDAWAAGWLAGRNVTG